MLLIGVAPCPRRVAEELLCHLPAISQTLLVCVIYKQCQKLPPLYVGEGLAHSEAVSRARP